LTCATIEGTRVQPEALTVKVGDTVVWVNKDLFPHSATAGEAKFARDDAQETQAVGSTATS
jgi:plastocyanin